MLANFQTLVHQNQFVIYTDTCTFMKQLVGIVQMHHQLNHHEIKKIIKAEAIKQQQATQHLKGSHCDKSGNDTPLDNTKAGSTLGCLHHHFQMSLFLPVHITQPQNMASSISKCLRCRCCRCCTTPE